jgi:hypothetical protein
MRGGAKQLGVSVAHHPRTLWLRQRRVTQREVFGIGLQEISRSKAECPWHVFGNWIPDSPPAYGSRTITGSRHSLPRCCKHNGMVCRDRCPNGQALRSYWRVAHCATRPMCSGDWKFLVGPVTRGSRKTSKVWKRSKVRSCSKPLERNGSSGRIRTYNPPVNSRMLCH